MTSGQVHWRTSRLLEVPPVLLVTEGDPMNLRMALASFIDGSRANELLSRSVLAIRQEYDLAPHAYVVALPQFGLELPIDLRAISDEPDHLVGIVSPPRSISDTPFLLSQLDEGIAGKELRQRRSYAIQTLKDMSRNGPAISVTDIGDRDNLFVHTFTNGVYHHSYHYLAAHLPDDSET
jgi:hypothetical protein